MSWVQYLEETRERPLRRLYCRALELRASDLDPKDVGFAIDLGCGTGTESLDLLRRGWRVLSVDQEPRAIESLGRKVSAREKERLQTRPDRLEEIENLPESELVFAYHSLPFCEKAYLPGVFWQIYRSLKPGGFFVGSFFGREDDWVKADQVAGMSSDSLLNSISGYRIRFFEEIKFRAPSALAGEKSWHYYEFIAQR